MNLPTPQSEWGTSPTMDHTKPAQRPFRVLGVQQIAIGAENKSRLNHLWIDLLGLERRGQYRNEDMNVNEDIAVVGTGPGEVEVDLMEPIDPLRSPRVHQPPLNHVGLWVDDLPAAMTWLRSQGVRFTGPIRPGAAGHDVCFIHPKGDESYPQGGEGVLIELIQSP